MYTVYSTHDGGACAERQQLKQQQDLIISAGIVVAIESSEARSGTGAASGSDSRSNKRQLQSKDAEDLNASIRSTQVPVYNPYDARYIQ